MARLRAAWRNWQTLGPVQRLLVMQAWLLLPLVAIGLRLAGFRHVRAALLAPADLAWRTDPAAAQEVARLVNGAACWTPLHTTCLARALVLCRLLQAQGLEARLHIGLARTGDLLAGHAWVEHDGVALHDSQDVAARFVPFDRDWLAEGWPR